jgi:hypothetical protein
MGRRNQNSRAKEGMANYIPLASSSSSSMERERKKEYNVSYRHKGRAKTRCLSPLIYVIIPQRLDYTLFDPRRKELSVE